MIIKGLIARFGKSEFFKNTTILSSGTVVSQVIAVFTAPILTRIYFPADYGLLGIYMVFCALIATISTLQYHNAIITEHTDEKAKDVLELSLLINFAVSILLLLFTLLCRRWISSLYHNPDLQKWLLFSPLSVFFIGVNSIFSGWAVRKKRFTLLSYNRIVSALLAPVFSIILGFLILGPVGLLTGLLISQVLPTIRMGYFFLRVDHLHLHFNKEKLLGVLKRYKNFPLFSLPAEFINSFSNQLPVMMLSQTGGVQVVGWYNLSVRMLGLPTTLVSTAIADVFRQRATYDYHHYGNCRPIFMKVFKTLLLISVVPVTVVLLFGPGIFAFVFGERWREAGKIAQVISVLYAFKFVISPLSYVTYIANKQWIGLIIDVLLLITLASILFVANAYHLSYKDSLLIFSIGYCLLYLLTFYLSYKFTVNEEFVRSDNPAN